MTREESLGFAVKWKYRMASLPTRVAIAITGCGSGCGYGGGGDVDAGGTVAVIGTGTAGGTGRTMRAGRFAMVTIEDRHLGRQELLARRQPR